MGYGHIKAAGLKPLKPGGESVTVYKYRRKIYNTPKERQQVHNQLKGKKVRYKHTGKYQNGRGLVEITHVF
jgi:hypothetical protein